MDNGPGWLLDPADGDREAWSAHPRPTRVRPAGKAHALRLPDHVPELQRALAGATADIDAVEDRLSAMFDRHRDPGRAADAADPAHPPGHRRSGRRQRLRRPLRSGRRSLRELDATLAAEEAEKVDDADEVEEPKKPKRGLFRRRT